MSRGNNPFDQSNRPHWERSAEEGRERPSRPQQPTISIEQVQARSVFQGNPYASHSSQEHSESFKKKQMYNEALEELNGLQGMGNVKDTIMETLALAQTFKAREKYGLKNEQHALHMIFTGNAGTGKTTVARLVGKLYVGAGLLSKGSYKATRSGMQGHPLHSGDDDRPKGDVPFVECTNADISSPFWGEDEKNMKKKFDQANGGVLFMDEAYSMISRSGHRSGEKVMAVMVAEMENRRNNICVIGAGYPNEMEEFLQYNEGLASRFASVVHFPNYEVETLLTIATGMAKDRDYQFSEEYRVALAERMEKERLLPSFGNARTVRNIIEQSIRKQAKRLYDKYGTSPSREHLVTLEKEDLSEFNPVYTGEKIEDEYLKLYNEAIRKGIVTGDKAYRPKTPKQ